MRTMLYHFIILLNAAYIHSIILTNGQDQIQQVIVTTDSSNVSNNLENISCIKDSVCSYCSVHGICKPNNTKCYCQCNEGYIDTNDQYKCNYKQKSRSTAYLLEIFFGLVGVGYLYLELYDIAYEQIYLFLGMIPVCIFFLIFLKGRNQNGKEICITTILFFYILVVIINWINGCASIRSYSSDGNGYPITS